jgi:hypothetical protein
VSFEQEAFFFFEGLGILSQNGAGPSIWAFLSAAAAAAAATTTARRAAS